MIIQDQDTNQDIGHVVSGNFMKLKEILVKEILLKEFCEHLEETTAAMKSVQGKLARLLDDSKDLVFKPFGITAKDPKYFIAGSARLYLYPQLAEILKLKEVGDLDMVVPGELSGKKYTITINKTLIQKLKRVN